MHLHTHIHKIHIIKNELSEVYLNLSIQSFALSMIAIFIPIYLLKIGYIFNEMILFFIVFYGTIGFLSPISSSLANKFGFKHIILLRTPLLIAFLLGINFIETLGISIYLFAFIGGFASSLYWNSINSLFAEHSDKIHRGSQSSKLVSLPQISALLGPTIGGLIVYILGFNILFLTVTFFILISVIPLFFTGDTKPHVNFSFKKMLKIKKNPKFFTYFFLDGAKFIAGSIFWPIFVYWGLDNSSTLTGFSHTVSCIGILLFTLYMGKKTDTSNKYHLIKKGALLIGLLWFVRILSKNPLDFFVLSFLAGLFTVLLDIPFMALSFNQANKENPDEFVVFREISLGFGRVFFLALTLIASSSILKIFFSFSLAGLGTLAFVFF